MTLSPTRILFIAYYFPPMGGGGVQRSLRFCRYLPEFNIHPVVLTAASDDDTRWAPRDPGLAKLLGSSLEIERTRKLRLNESAGRLGRRITTLFGLTPPFGVEWRQALLEKGREILSQRKDISLIYISLSPFEGALAAAELAREFNLPWVADLRDPWALDEMMVYPSAIHRLQAELEMKRALRSACRVIMNTPESAARLKRRFPGTFDETATYITNGYDAKDFAHRTPRPSPFFRIVHTGSFHSELGITLANRAWLTRLLGRTRPGVDYRSRSPLYFVEALLTWFKLNPDARALTRFSAVGQLESWDRDALRPGELGENLEIVGYCSHDETIQRQVDADLLFLPMQSLPAGTRATIVPGKAYEYLASGTPILAALPEGDARDFVVAAGGNFLCPPMGVKEMVEALETAFQRWQANGRQTARRENKPEMFERRNLTAALAEQLRLSLCSPSSS